MIDEEAAPPRRRWLRVLLPLLVAFVAGSVAMGYALTHWDAAARYLRGNAPAEPPQAAPVRLVPVPVEAPPSPSAAALDAAETRVAELERRVGALDARARAVAGDADHAEALLVAFAVRRTVDRGVPLGYLEGLLRERFGALQPQAVATVVAASRRPVTLDELHAGLDTLAPALAGAGPAADWWMSLRRELAGLIVIRRSDVPSSAPEDRVARAALQVEAGHVDRALAEVARLPSRDAAAGWITDARRYLAAHAALDALETAALLAPRTAGPRPSSGAPAAPR